MYKNQVFVPVYAKHESEIKTALAIQEPLTKIGYRPGIMLVMKNGLEGLNSEETENQIKNLEKFSSQYGNADIVVMLSNIPIDDIDTLHNPSIAFEHLKLGIDFASNLPLGKRKIVTFHLNSLVEKNEFLLTCESIWIKKFNWEVCNVLMSASQYAKDIKIEIKVETTPVPEFGDRFTSDDNFYECMQLNNLRNPFYLTHLWGFEQVRNAGLGICLDICHNRTIYETAKAGDLDNCLIPAQTALLQKSCLFDDVKNLKQKDLVHLNDGDGIFNSKKNTVFREGLILGKGDIVNLKEIVNYLNKKQIPFVIEVIEDNFQEMPKTKQSIEYLLNI